MNIFGLELTEAEIESITNIHTTRRQVVKYDQTLEGLLEDWRCQVDEIERGYRDTIYEYTNDVRSRQVLDDLIQKCPKRIRTKLLELLGPLDDRFLELTEVPCLSDEHPNLPGIENDRWARIPNHPVGLVVRN